MAPGLAGVVQRDILTSSLCVQPKLSAVHLRTLSPIPRFVTWEVGLEGVVMAAVPLTRLQVPVPAEIVFPARVAVDEHTVWSGPAFGTVGARNVWVPLAEAEPDLVSVEVIFDEVDALTAMVAPLTTFAFTSIVIQK